VSQIKYCCSFKSKYLAPLKSFGLATLLLATPLGLIREIFQESRNSPTYSAAISEDIGNHSETVQLAIFKNLD